MIDNDLSEGRTLEEAPCIHCKYDDCSYNEYPCNGCIEAPEEFDWPCFVGDENMIY